MRTNPAVSVVVPVHNNEKTVRRSLESLLSQSLKHLEIVVVLDGCCDESAKEVRQLAKGESRLRIVALEENVGVMAARARGVSETTAPFVGFADADDVAKSRMYELLLESAQSAEADIVVGSADRVSAERRFLGPKVAFRKNAVITRSIFESYCSLRFGSGVLWNKLYRRNLIVKHGLALPGWRQDTSEDTIVNIGCFLDAQRVAVMKESVYEYIEREGSATAYQDSAAALCGLVRGYAAALEIHSSRPPHVLAGISRLYFKQATLRTYRVDDPGQLVWHEESLVEALRVILRVYPAGLAVVAPDPEIWRSYSVRRSLANINTEIRALAGLMFDRLKEKFS